MTRKNFFLCLGQTVAALSLGSVSCFAADVDGKWSGNINTPRGAVPMSFDWKAEDGKLTGTAVGPQGPVPISAGLYEDGKVTFQLRYRVYDKDMVFHYQGTMKGDQIDMMLMFGINEPVPFVIKREKKEEKEK